MRKLVLSLMSAVALVVAGCNASTPPPPTDAGAPAPTPAGTAAATPIPSEVSGTIALREPGQLSPAAKLVINLVNVSSDAVGSAPLASKTVAPVGQFPQPFQLTLNPADVKPGDIYVVQVLLTDGERQYSMPIQAPVLTKGSKNDGVAIELVSQQTPGEKVLAAFTAQQKLLGGMKVNSGTKLEKEDSRGWQLFREAGRVEFIRELVDYGDKGFTSTDYAYRDGKPWAIVQETKTSRDAKPGTIDRAGWDESGLLVLKQHQVGGDVQALDTEAAAKLQKQAQDILGLATGGKDK